MKKIFKFILGFMLCAGVCSWANLACARESNLITDWYIVKYTSEIIVNKDSSLDITENILADCGNLPDKHGIYRVIPYQSYGENNEVYKTPISKIVVATDADGQSVPYTQSNNRSDKTITLKIGDADKAVTGKNLYVIKYHAENAIRTANDSFDELYWNLNGNFWDIETDNYSATITFPPDFSKNNSQINLYAGGYGQNDQSLAEYSWVKDNVLQVKSNRTLGVGEGITISSTYNKGYFTPYDPPFWDKYGFYFYFLLPLLALYISYSLWKKYGRDPYVSPTIAPEFEIPEKLSPLDMGMVMSDGSLHNNFITASIINLAVKGLIRIELVPKKGLLGTEDYILIKTDKQNKDISQSENELMQRLFVGDQEVSISSLKNNFYRHLPDIRDRSMNFLSSRGLIIKSSRTWMAAFIGIAAVVGFFSFYAFSFDTIFGLCVLSSAIILLVFAPFMKRRSISGAKFYKRIQGFKLYMDKAETYRQQWLEKQNIFEQFLPYAIMFGIAKEWTTKLGQIYGEEFMNSYHPIWYYGTVGNFSFSQLNNSIEKMSSTISSTLTSNPSSSGSGGGGFSGGGGGGGGGGGW